MKDFPNVTLSTLSALTVVLGSAWLVPSVAQAADYDISITADGFVPDYLEVTVGDRVFWWNDDYTYYDYHSTRSYAYPWYSGWLDVGQGAYLETGNTGQTGSFDYVDDVGYVGWGTLVIKPPVSPPIPVTSPKDLVYDASRDILYITSGSSVLRYQLATDSFLTPFQLTGNLMGLDLSPDGNTLVVADYSVTTNVWVHVIDLPSGQSHKALFPAAFGESGTYAVAFGGDGAALITSRFAGSGWVPLRRFDPSSGAVTTIGSVNQDSMVSCSGDGTMIIIAESNNSGGPIDCYDVAKRAITRTGGDGWFNYECAASRDASLFAIPTYGGTFIYDTNLNLVTKIGVYAGSQPIAAAFHPAADVVFFPFVGTSYVEAYDTTSWQLLGMFDCHSTFNNTGNDAFVNGRIRLSPDGEIIFVTVSGGVRYMRHNLNVPLTHRLLVSANPRPYGTPSPIGYGSCWLPHGTNLTLSVPAVVATNGTCVVSTGWSGTGSALGSGNTNEADFTLNANSALTWNWMQISVTANVQVQGGGQQLVLQWPSLSGRTYDVLFASNLLSGFASVATTLPATVPTNTYQATLGAGRAGFYKVIMK